MYLVNGRKAEGMSSVVLVRVVSMYFYIEQ